MQFPSSSLRGDPIAQAYISRLAQMDIAFQQNFKSWKKRWPLFFLLRQEDGSGFRMAKMLRYYFEDYNHRLLNHGPHSLPTSFNVVQGFLKFNKEILLFDIRQECEHLMRLQDYFDWYTSEQGIPDDPKILIDVLPEGVIYSYDMLGDSGEYTISTEGSRLAIVGVSLVRHKNDLSIILLSGENPPNPPDSKLPIVGTQYPRSKWKEGLSSDESFSIQDRYMDGLAGFAKVLLLTRFNLASKRHDVRYLNIDTGPTFLVHSDDPNCLDPDTIEEDERNKIIQNSISVLDRYNQLFSALSSLIYLPIMFIAENYRVDECKFTTNLGISTQKLKVRKAAKEFGRKALTLSRSVRCLTSGKTENIIGDSRRIIEPPDFSFETTGFWKPIGPNEIGEDESGNPIVGQTWVERKDAYSVKSAESFVISRKTKVLIGNDPGFVYIMRNPSHGNDLYKIGLTRRSTEQRAQELGSSTASPLPFGVIASYEVGDCGAIEKEVHSRLKPYRVSRRREFFLISLSKITQTVEQAIEDTRG